tara:strand:+ start:683 stop:919 length:237 start_codon:yes stop_codon:yes gene_type:complete
MVLQENKKRLIKTKNIRFFKFLVEFILFIFLLLLITRYSLKIKKIAKNGEKSDVKMQHLTFFFEKIIEIAKKILANDK